MTVAASGGGGIGAGTGSKKAEAQAAGKQAAKEAGGATELPAGKTVGFLQILGGIESADRTANAAQDRVAASDTRWSCAMARATHQMGTCGRACWAGAWTPSSNGHRARRDRLQLVEGQGQGRPDRAGRRPRVPRLRRLLLPGRAQGGQDSRRLRPQAAGRAARQAGPAGHSRLSRPLGDRAHRRAREGDQGRPGLQGRGDHPDRSGQPGQRHAQDRDRPDHRQPRHQDVLVLLRLGRPGGRPGGARRSSRARSSRTSRWWPPSTPTSARSS